jgi:hypothetical protein
LGVINGETLEIGDTCWDNRKSKLADRQDIQKKKGWNKVCYTLDSPAESS